MRTDKKRKWSNWILALLVIWQVVPMITSFIGPALYAKESEPTLNETDRLRFQLLIHPSESEVRKSEADIENIVTSQMAAMPLWREAMRRLLAGQNTESVMADLEPKLPSSPPGLAEHYRLAAWGLGSDVWRRDREETLRTALDYGYRDASVLNELKTKLPDKSTYIGRQIDTYVLALVQERRFDEAIDVMSSRIEAREVAGEREKTISGLKQLREKPDDLEANLAIADGVLFGYAGAETALEFCYRLWPTAKTPEEKAHLLRASLSAFSHNGNKESSRFLCNNAVTLTAKAVESHDENWAELLGTVAGLEAEEGNKELARELYQFLAQTFPSSPNWGVNQYNYALLLQQTGYHARAEAAARQLLDSSVNDKNEGPNLMDTYRNYRHESSLLISDARSSMGDFEGALRWRDLAINKYKYVSWCGTCSYLEASRNSWNLFLASIWAGPIPLIRYFTFHPYNLIFFSPIAVTGAIVGLSVVFWRRRKRRRAMISPEQ